MSGLQNKRPGAHTVTTYPKQGTRSPPKKADLKGRVPTQRAHIHSRAPLACGALPLVPTSALDWPPFSRPVSLTHRPGDSKEKTFLELHSPPPPAQLEALFLELELRVLELCVLGRVSVPWRPPNDTAKVCGLSLQGPGPQSPWRLGRVCQGS